MYDKIYMYFIKKRGVPKKLGVIYYGKYSKS